MYIIAFRFLEAVVVFATARVAGEQVLLADGLEVKVELGDVSVLSMRKISRLKSATVSGCLFLIAVFRRVYILFYTLPS